MIVIGATGSFGSGCSFIAKEYISKPFKYEYISLSQILRNIYKEQKGKNPPKNNRKILQDFGDELRETYGSDILANKAADLIEKNQPNNYIIDSIRNPEEIKYLKNHFAEFYLMGIFANYEKRWIRVKDTDTYKENRKKFDKDDRRDVGEEVKWGQRVRDCYKLADFIIENNDEAQRDNDAHQLLTKLITRYINLINNTEEFIPTEMEALMAMAYANSFRSSCLKRKVGAIIVDDFGNIFSSGYNEVPKDEKTCKNKYGCCYRDSLKKTMIDKFKKIIKDATKMEKIEKEILYIKNLDYCRSLHAEENAILNVARHGSSLVLKDATLYTTTFPCNLCANKIVYVGISNIVYLEPYPMKEASDILVMNNISQEPFKGVLYNGYFRFWRNE